MEDVLWFARDDAGATAIVSGTEHRHLQALARRRGPRHAACGRAIGMSRRDHLKRGTLQIVFGLLCTAAGCPIAVQVFEGSRTSLPRPPTSCALPDIAHRFATEVAAKPTRTDPAPPAKPPRTVVCRQHRCTRTSTIPADCVH